MSKHFTVEWTPDDKIAKNLTMKFKEPLKKSKKDFILEIHDVRELTDLNVKIEFYLGNYLRDRYLCHAFIGEQKCISQNPKVEKNVNSFDTDEYFMFNRIEMSLDQKIEFLHFTFK